MIPKANGNQRRLGIATIADRVVQASLVRHQTQEHSTKFLPTISGI
jgi:retron-type reverse transcriptase